MLLGWHGNQSRLAGIPPCVLYKELITLGSVRRVITLNSPDCYLALYRPQSTGPGGHTHSNYCAMCVTSEPLRKKLSFPIKPVTLTTHQQYSGLLAISQLRQLVLFNMKCSPIHTLAGVLKNTSIKKADLFSHCQSQLPSAKHHCMCSWHNFINNLGKQRILQQIAVAF